MSKCWTRRQWESQPYVFGIAQGVCLSDSSLSQCVSEDTGKTYGPKGPTRVTVLAFWSPVKDVASLRH